MDFGIVEIDFRKVTDDNGSRYEVNLDIPWNYIICHVDMYKADLKQFRNMVHNLLMDLNQELNYED